MSLPKVTEDNRVSNRTLYCLCLYNINYAYWLGVKGYILLKRMQEPEYFENLIRARSILEESMYFVSKLPEPLKQETRSLAFNIKEYLDSESYESCSNTNFSDTTFAMLQHLNSIVMPCVIGGIYRRENEKDALKISNKFFHNKIDNSLRLIRHGGFVRMFSDYLNRIEVIDGNMERRLTIRYSLLLDDYKRLLNVIRRKIGNSCSVALDFDEEIKFLVSQLVYAQISFSSYIINCIR